MNTTPHKSLFPNSTYCTVPPRLLQLLKHQSALQDIASRCGEHSEIAWDLIKAVPQDTSPLFVTHTYHCGAPADRGKGERTEPMLYFTLPNNRKLKENDYQKPQEKWKTEERAGIILVCTTRQQSLHPQKPQQEMSQYQVFVLTSQAHTLPNEGTSRPGLRSIILTYHDCLWLPSF